jgi:hypothetical protein
VDGICGAAFISAVDFFVEDGGRFGGPKATRSDRRMAADRVSQPVVNRMRFLALIVVAALIAACTPEVTPAAKPLVLRPYIVPPSATKAALLDWSERAVNACFGQPVASDIIAGVPRHFYRRDRCAQYFIFKDGKVLSVEGYGAEEECWWVAEACERGQEFRPAALTHGLPAYSTR